MFDKLFRPFGNLKSPAPLGPTAATAPVVIFIHGFTGTASAWQPWLNIMQSDPSFSAYKVDTFAYRTAVFSFSWGKRAPKLSEIAAGLDTEIRMKFPSAETVCIVAHSMGGLVARQFLLHQVAMGRPVERYRLLMYATPTLGAQVASLAAWLKVPKGQLTSMGINSDFLEKMNRSWIDEHLEQKLLVNYVIGGADQVVNPESAGFAEGSPSVHVAVDLGHTDIIDVAKKLPYSILKDFVATPFQPVNKTQTSSSTSTAGAGDPLFTIYHMVDEPFYLERGAVDEPIEAAIQNSHVWLSGVSGVGKTSILRRNAWRSGFKIIPIMLSANAPGDLHELQSSFYAKLADALDVGSIESSEDLKRALAKYRQTSRLCLLIEEIPFENLQDYELVLAWLVNLTIEIDADERLKGAVRLIFSSISLPSSISAGKAAKAREQIQFIAADSWTQEELERLVELISKAVGQSFSPENLLALCQAAEGRPRLIKQVLRDFRNRPRADITMQQRIAACQ